MERFDTIRTATLEESLRLLQHDECNEAISSTFFKDVRSKLTAEKLDKIVKSKPDAASGTALAKTLSAFGGGFFYGGRITLYKSFFEDFNIAIGPHETGQSLGISMDQRRVIVLLHELTHLTRKYIDVFQNIGIHYFDEAIYDKSTINKRIYDACFGESVEFKSPDRTNRTAV